MKYRELIYMVLDELKVNSDDAYFTEDHVKFLLNIHRSKLIKDTYSSIKKEIPQSYYQCITLNLELTSSVEGMPCVGEVYLQSKQRVPAWIPVANPVVFPVDILTGLNMARVPMNRFRVTGNNKWLSNIIYFTLGPNNVLYCKSANPQFQYLEKVSFYAVFEDVNEANQISCCSCEEGVCDPLDKEFPIEEALAPLLVQNVVKELLGSVYKPEDTENNSADDLPDEARGKQAKAS